VAQARAARLDIAFHRLQAIYARSRTSGAAGQDSSSSGKTASFGESGSEEAEEAGDDGVTESSQGTGNDEDSEEDAP
jgi:hypothetical protein